MLAHALAALALVQAGLGQREAAREQRAARRWSWPAASTPARLMLDAHYALGLEALGAGRPQDAIDELAQCVAIAAARTSSSPGSSSGRPTTSRRSSAPASPTAPAARWRALEADGGAHRAPVGARGRGALPRPDGGRRLVRGGAAARAGRCIERSDQPFERARTELVLGERLRRARRLADAREPLRSALATFERLGARDWASRARDELRTAGATTGEAPAVRRGFDELTAHELRIALLAARGRSNPEIAADLVLSRKTIEYHLGQVYRKLGLRSRTELAAHLAGAEGGRLAS